MITKKLFIIFISLIILSPTVCYSVGAILGNRGRTFYPYYGPCSNGGVLEPTIMRQVENVILHTYKGVYPNAEISIEPIYDQTGIFIKVCKNNWCLDYVTIRNNGNIEIYYQGFLVPKINYNEWAIKLKITLYSIFNKVPN